MSEPWQTQTINTSQVTGDSMPSAELLPVPSSRAQPKTLNARYELAERTPELNEQFARAAGGSGLQTTSHLDRATIRDRVRHEMLEADPWMHGSQRTTTVSVIGRGPWLEVKIPGQKADSKLISDAFNKWFRKKRVHGPRKFRTMCWSQGAEGTGLAMIVNDPKVSGKVKLNFVPFEDEQVRANPASGNFNDTTNYLLDGKEYDDVGCPSKYWVCDQHPAEHPGAVSKPVDAQYVIDVWEQLRPSQGKGVSVYATSTKNGPLRRTYRRAVLDAAATAAKLSYLLKTNIDRFEGGEENFEDVDSLTELPLVYGEGMALPKGWEPFQMRAEQPTTGHDEFMNSNIAETGRPAGQPGSVTTADAKGLNFASGSLARADWAEDVDVRRQDWETLGLDLLFEHWLREAALAGVIPRQYADIDDVDHEYRWTRKRHQDTNKEYSGRAKAIATGQTSRAQWQTDDGLNPDVEDQAAADGFNVSLKVYRAALFVETFPQYHLAMNPLGNPGNKGTPDDDDSDGTETADAERKQENREAAGND